MGTGTGEPGSPEEPIEDDLVDEAGKESFPASDPPPFWARDPEPERGAAASNERRMR